MNATLEWFTVATWRLRVNGLTLMLDAYITDIPMGDRVALSLADIDEAHYIVIGHSHFDHLMGASELAIKTGAKIIGTPETARLMRQEGVPDSRLIATEGGQTFDLGRGVKVTAYPSYHSTLQGHIPRDPTEAPRDDYEGTSADAAIARRAAEAEQQGYGVIDLKAAQEYLEQVMARYPADGGTLVFRFEWNGRSLFWQDSAGYKSSVLQHVSCDTAILSVAGRGTVDGKPSGDCLADFLAQEVALLRPRLLLANHHDGPVPPIMSRVDTAPVFERIQRWVPGVACIAPEPLKPLAL